jgi:hypothetical protein
VADHHDFCAVISGHATDDGGIVAKCAVAVHFTPVSKNAFDIIQRKRPLGVTGEFSLLPRIDVSTNLFTQEIDLVLEMLELEMRFLVLAGFGLKLNDLLLNGF